IEMRGATRIALDNSQRLAFAWNRKQAELNVPQRRRNHVIESRAIRGVEEGHAVGAAKRVFFPGSGAPVANEFQIGQFRPADLADTPNVVECARWRDRPIVQIDLQESLAGVHVDDPRRKDLARLFSRGTTRSRTTESPIGGGSEHRPVRPRTV